VTLLVGVDAGASHTEAVVADGALHVRGRSRGAPGAVRAGRAAAAAEAISAAVRKAIAQAGLTAAPDAVVVGAAGAGRDETRAELTKALAQALGTPPAMLVTTDVTKRRANPCGYRGVTECMASFRCWPVAYPP